nr:myrosinase 1-like [Halyomorpha halys]
MKFVELQRYCIVFVIVTGKGENIWDRLVHTNPSVVANNDNGDVACDTYHKYKEDIQNMKTIGFQMHRFSLSWSRLFPDGFVTKPNPDGVRFYNDFIDELLKNGIKPMVSIYHWDLPQPLQDMGGWLNPLIVDIFGDYAREVYKLFGKKVKWWIPINEPMSISTGYGSVHGAPMLNLHGIGEYLSVHNVLLAHAKAYRIYDKEFRSSQKGKVGLNLSDQFVLPKNASNPEDVAAAERGNQFVFGWIGHPVYGKGGDYPAVMREYVDRKSKEEGYKQSRLPYFSKEEIETLKGSSDYLALNHYSCVLATTGATGETPSISRDQNIIKSIDESWTKSHCDWLLIVPEGFKKTLRWLRREYDNPEIFITENGFCGSDNEDDDKLRIEYIKKYLSELIAAIKEGSKVIGYNHWSLMDNFEWLDGYTSKFGLMRVDFKDPNRTRTFRNSASLFNQIIKQNSK